MQFLGGTPVQLYLKATQLTRTYKKEQEWWEGNAMETCVSFWTRRSTQGVIAREWDSGTVPP